MARDTQKNDKANENPASQELFPAFPEPAGWAMNWEGHALGLFTIEPNHPIQVANDVRPTDKPNRT
jgi:hypothetical protein